MRFFLYFLNLLTKKEFDFFLICFRVFFCFLFLEKNFKRYGFFGDDENVIWKALDYDEFL